MHPVVLSAPFLAPSRRVVRRPPRALAVIAALGLVALLAAAIGGGARRRALIDPADPGGSAVHAVEAALARASAARVRGDEASALSALDEAAELVATARAAFHPLSGLHLAVPVDPRTGAPRTVEAFQAELDALEATIERRRLECSTSRLERRAAPPRPRGRR
jgi:hypothetical protein